MAKPGSPLYGIPVNEIARLCGVDVSTARRWKRGAICPPKTAILLLIGDLGMFHKAWAGWVVRNDTLVSPEGWAIPVGELRATPLLRAQLAVYQAENRNLKADLEEARAPQMEDQPEPESWSFGVG